MWLVNKTRTTFSTNGNPNQNQSSFHRTRFPALGASYMYLFRILNGSLCCLNLFRLAWVITLVMVLRHSIGSRSYYAFWTELSSIQCQRNSRLLCFCFATLWLVKKFAPFSWPFKQLEVWKVNESWLVRTRFPALQCSSHYLLVFTSKSDWFIALFTSVVIGQINNSGFGFMILNSKPLLLGTFQQCE